MARRWSRTRSTWSSDPELKYDGSARHQMTFARPDAVADDVEAVVAAVDGNRGSSGNRPVSDRATTEGRR